MAKKILFVEDDRALQKALGEALKNEGYEMISAFTGEDGLKMAEKEKPDLILLDLILPKMYGLDVLKKLKENFQTKEIPVVILTNVEKIEDVEKAIEMGAKGYLIKTYYTLKDILEKVKKELEK